MSIIEAIGMEYIILMGGLVIVGELFKRYTTLPNYLLTTALPLLGAFATSIGYVMDAEVFLATELIQQICLGLMVGWSATGGYEFFINTFVKKETVKKVIYTERLPLVLEEEVEDSQINEIEE